MKNDDFNDFCYVFDCFYWLESIGNGSKYRNKTKMNNFIEIDFFRLSLD